MHQGAEPGPRVVIVGAGFGGLAAAEALSRAPVRLTVIDRQNHHCFQPLLYQVATAALTPAEVAWPIRGILHGQANARVLMAEVQGVDTAARRVRTDQGDFPYDLLVLATGATHAYFGHDDWAPFAPGLKRIADATDIRRRVLEAFERAELADDEVRRAALTTFVVIGGGPTGVEMAGAIADLAHKALAADFRNVEPARARIDAPFAQADAGRVDPGDRRAGDHLHAHPLQHPPGVVAEPLGEGGEQPRPGRTGVPFRASRRRPSRWAAMSAG